ncbi:MAG: hypothetical protein II411_01965, partial [Lachnospiraceae bacterium]|nr:hypothetical protein [Lachnospiraceae bacterium]
MSCDDIAEYGDADKKVVVAKLINVGAKLCEPVYGRVVRARKNMSKQIKSKKRVSEHGEVFTNEREVNAMLDLVKDETLRIDSRFLEPACGDGNFLIEILRRKMDVVNKKYKKDEKEWEKQSLVAIMSCYGVELLQDNVEVCIDRLYKFWEKEYEKHCEKIKSEKVKQVAKFVLSKNILCGNALTMLCVDKNGNV